MAKYDKKRIAELIDGRLEFYQLKEMMSSHKDPERFELYREVLQERVPWDDPSFFRMGFTSILSKKKMEIG